MLRVAGFSRSRFAAVSVFYVGIEIGGWPGARLAGSRVACRVDGGHTAIQNYLSRVILLLQSLFWMSIKTDMDSGF